MRKCIIITVSIIFLQIACVVIWWNFSDEMWNPQRSFLIDSLKNYMTSENIHLIDSIGYPSFRSYGNSSYQTSSNGRKSPTSVLNTNKRLEINETDKYTRKQTNVYDANPNDTNITFVHDRDTSLTEEELRYLPGNNVTGTSTIRSSTKQVYQTTSVVPALDFSSIDIPDPLNNMFADALNLVNNATQMGATIDIYSDKSSVQNNNGVKDKLLQDWPFDIKKCYAHKEDVNSNECSHLMSVRRKPSRYGNQMFQVASLLGTAFYHGYTPVIPPNFPILDIFNLPNVKVIDLDKFSIFSEKGGMTYTPAITSLSHSKNWTLTGFLQSWKYFKGAETFVRKAFEFKEKYTTAARKFLDSVSKQGYQNVCIHVRYFTKTPRNIDYYIPSPKYISKAKEFFKQRYRDVIFILLSHDMKWVKKNIDITGIHLSPFKDPGSDMALMANCDHMILTAGTFGWWGAWLSGGDVVYWKKFVDGRSKVQKDFVTNYYPTRWISMD